MALLLMMFVVTNGQAQQRITIDEAISKAIQNNQQLSINQSQVAVANYQKKASVNIPKTGVFAENEDLRPSDQVGILKVGISQSIDFPTLYSAQKRFNKEQLKYAQMNGAMIEAGLKKEVRSAYYQLWYLQEKQDLLLQLDSLYTNIHRVSKLRVQTGDVAALDEIAADTKLQELKAQQALNDKDMQVQQQQLMVLFNEEKLFLPENKPLVKLILSLPQAQALQHPVLALQQQKVNVAAAHVSVQRNSNLPELSGRFFSQRLWGAANPFTGFSVTASFPLFSAIAARNNVLAATAAKDVEQKTLLYQMQLLENEKSKAHLEIEKSLALLQFYESSGLQQAKMIISAAGLSYKAGEISFAELSQFYSQAIGIRQNYIEALNQFNQAIIQYDYTNNK